jgi:hypothetical protein
MEKRKKIFISHLDEDKEIVGELVEFIRFLGLDETQFFCTSSPGSDVRLGENIINRIKSELDNATLVLFIFSYNFNKSIYCLSEMGAVSALSKEYIPIVIPPFEFSDIKGLIFSTDNGVIINNRSHLIHLEDMILEHFDITLKSRRQHDDKLSRVIANIDGLLKKRGMNKPINWSIFEKKGFVTIVEKKHDYAPVRQMLLDAKKSIKIMAYYGDALLHDLKEDIIQVINDNNLEKVELLLADENSILLDEVLALENMKTTETTEKECASMKKYYYDTAERAIDQIKRGIGNKRDILNIYRYNTQIRYTITIVDEKRAFWTPYHPGKITGHCLTFELIDKGEDSLFWFCNSHFNQLVTYITTIKKGAI